VITWQALRWTLWLGAAVASAGAAPAFAQTDVSDAPAAASDSEPPRSKLPNWQLRLAAGGGFGTRDLDLPRDGAVYQTRTGVFPAVDVGFTLDHAFSDDFSVGLHARYRTSVGLRITEHHTGGTERAQHLRSHRIETGLASSVRLDAQGLWMLTASLGYGMSDLRPEVHLQTPGYVLGGPFLRAELQLPLGTDRIRLRLGPEAQWIVEVGRELTYAGFATSGVGFGGTATLEILLSERWSVDATYNELRAWLDSPQSQSLQDASRFVTARLTGAL
jgi:hypothetical protein